MAQGQNTPTSSRDRLTQRISALTMSHVDAFATDVISNESGLLYNGRIEQYKNDPNRTYITHRPGMNISIPDTVGDGKGRGVYYWSAIDQYYFMNDDVIYKTNYSTPCSLTGGHTAIASGSDKVYFAEWSSANDDYLFIIDPENNGIYVIMSSASTTVINIANVTVGTGAPFNAGDDFDFVDLKAAIAANGGLCHGAVDLNGYLFLGMSNGQIYNSGSATDSSTWLEWNALGFVTVDRSPDKLQYIGKQRDHVIAIGGASLEVYYDNANAAPASPLTRRQDVSLNTGCTFGSAVWENGDTIFFQAIDAGGDFYIASLTDFKLSVHANPTAQAYVWVSRYSEDMTAIMSGYSVGGHTYVVLTTLTTAGAGSYTLVYDATYDAWYQWETTANSNTEYQLIGYMKRAADNDIRPLAMFRSGDMALIQPNFIPIDFTSGVADVNITLKAVTDNFDAGTSETKFMHSCNYVGNQVASAQNLTVEWSDDNGATWSSSTLDLLSRTQINRMGKFVNRKFRLTIVGTQTVRFEGIDVTFTQGDH